MLGIYKANVGTWTKDGWEGFVQIVIASWLLAGVATGVKMDFILLIVYNRCGGHPFNFLVFD